MITKFDKLNAKALAAEIAAALQGIATKHGIAIDYNGGTVGDAEFTCKVRCKVADVDAVEKLQRREWNEYCGLFELTPEDYKRVVTTGRGLRVQLLGFALNRSKNPIRVLDLVTGKVMLYPEMLVQVLAGQREKTA